MKVEYVLNGIAKLLEIMIPEKFSDKPYVYAAVSFGGVLYFLEISKDFSLKINEAKFMCCDPLISDNGKRMFIAQIVAGMPNQLKKVSEDENESSRAPQKATIRKVILHENPFIPFSYNMNFLYAFIREKQKLASLSFLTYSGDFFQGQITGDGLVIEHGRPLTYNFDDKSLKPDEFESRYEMVHTSGGTFFYNKIDKKSLYTFNVEQNVTTCTNILQFLLKRDEQDRDSMLINVI